MAYSPLSLGDIVQQAGAIKGQQQRSQLADMQIQQGQADQANTQGIQSTLASNPNASLADLSKFGPQGIEASQKLSAAQMADLTNHYRQTYTAATAVANADDPVAAVQQNAPQFAQQYDRVHGQGAFAKLAQDPNALKQQAQQVADQAMAGLVDPDKQFQAHQTMIENHYKQEGPGGELARNQNTIAGENARSAASNAISIRGQNMTAANDVKPVTNPDGSVTYVQSNQAAGKQVGSAASGGMTPQMGDLMGALAERGVSLPTGLRSLAQQKSLYAGLISRNPDKSADQIADLIKAGKIDLAGEMKETSVAGGISGKVKYAENELTQSIPLAREASAAVDRGKFMPMTKLLQMANTQINDPDLLNLKIKTQSVLNAYDMLAARGGTDVGKRAAQHALLESAQSPEAYETALKAFTQEAQVAHTAADMSMNRTPAAPSAPAAPKAGALVKGYRFKGGDPANQANWVKSGG